MAIDHPRHDELAGRIDDADIAAACGYGRRLANSRKPIIGNADDAILYDLTVDRIKDGTADDVQESHHYLLACMLMVSASPTRAQREALQALGHVAVGLGVGRDATGVHRLGDGQLLP